MNAKRLVSFGLVSILCFGTPVGLAAQSNWPTPSATAAARPDPPAKARKAASKPKRRSVRKPTTVRVDETTLRTISDLITRQTVAIEALTQRLEATERRLEQAMLPTAELSRDIPGPFCAVRGVDWTQVFAEAGR